MPLAAPPDLTQLERELLNAPRLIKLFTGARTVFIPEISPTLLELEVREVRRSIIQSQLQDPARTLGI